MVKVAYITNIIAPYGIPFLNYLNSNEGIALKVFYIAEQEKDRLWKTYYDEMKYPFEILKGFHIYTKKRTIHLNWGMIPKLIRYNPHVIVIGTDIGSSPISWAALLYSKIRNIKIIRQESQTKYSVSGSRLKRWMYKTYYSFIDHFFVYSILTMEYLVSLGIDPSRITVGYNVGDTDYFSKGTYDYLHSNKYNEERGSYPEVLFLFAGRLIKWKNILELLAILKELDYSDIGLIILGEGELREQVLMMSKEFRNLRVYFEGFKQKEECIKYFSLADILVFPTLQDRASIVLGEALVSGLFVVGSIYDGSSANLIKSGQNGFIVDPQDRTALKKAIEAAYTMKKEGNIYKDKIKGSMDNFKVDKYAERLAVLIKGLL